ncbi:hypothetical protein ACUH78_19055, partial [Thauera sp. ZXT1-4]|uniref:hypothetical protein n=1 Tax=Thauera sp. ZXT1-4 TaxID=3460294 RepID=UPI0040409D07
SVKRSLGGQTGRLSENILRNGMTVSFSEDGCAKCQKPNALQQQRGLNPSGNDGRQAATKSHSKLRIT